MGRLTGCCCCFDLRDGSRAIGITLLVFGSLGLVLNIIGGVMMTQEESIASGQIGGLVLQFVASITQLVFNSLLVHGVNKNSRGLLLAWLIYSGIIYGLQSLAVAIGLVVVVVFGFFWWVFLLLLAVGGLLGLFWYWFVVVLHCYLDMRQDNGRVYSKQEREGEMLAL